MKSGTNRLASSIRLALSLGGITAASIANTAAAQDATAGAEPKSLETVTVTGSNIRRVDLETANPVLTIDHAQIEKSGKLTLGDLIQALPSMSGGSTNPNVNNGGGSGNSTISLRGLGSQRSLLLINGHRVPTQMQDLNTIPASAVERIEVLSDGASSTYGTDAVAGVVNIITRTNYDGWEAGADYGISDLDDGQRKSYHAMWGHSDDKFNIILGVNYNKYDAVLAANRAYAHDALYKYNDGSIVRGGSSRTPNGAITLPASLINSAFGGCIDPATGKKIQSNSNRVTRITGTNGTKITDYRCYNPATDAFNFQAVGNYMSTPQERKGGFALGNYKITDNLQVFAELFRNKTDASSQLAPLPLDANSNGFFIPSTSYYNPFGVDFGINPVTGVHNNQFLTRLTSLGNRASHNSTTQDLGTAGFKGNFGESWSWFADVSFARSSKESQNVNNLNLDAIRPSLICASAPGSSACTPLNIFNIFDPATAAALKAAGQNATSTYYYLSRTYEAGASGTIYTLPAGDVSLAVGTSYRDEYINNQPDPRGVQHLDANLNLICSGPGSICGSPIQGGFNLKEAYAELLVPLLKDLPYVHSLNLDIGDRYSKYSNFGSTNNWKLAIEFRPIEELLLRATVSKVFRAPSATDLYTGPGIETVTVVDPKFPLQGEEDINAITSGSQWANNNLGTKTRLSPENGTSYDYGFVYDPEWLQGLSINADYYRIVLNNIIVGSSNAAQAILNQCQANPASPLCSTIQRSTSGSDAGQIQYVFETPYNAGTLSTKGVDLGLRYKVPETPFGTFRLGFQSTYIQEYNIDSAHLAGHFDTRYGGNGLQARWRALATVDWNNGPFSANWTTRYIGKVRIGYLNVASGPSAARNDTPDPITGFYPDPQYAIYNYGATVYNNVSFGYHIEPLHTQIEVGIDNLMNKQPPFFYFQNSINGGVDASTYDTIGRYFWGKVTVKF